jgi:hypothetical protein
MKDFIELKIIDTVRKLLTGKVNELLGDMAIVIPIIEFGNYSGSTAIVPVIALSTCERSEKERIVLQDAYSLTITFEMPETPESELYCYAYSFAVCKALGENTTLDGVAERAVISSKKFVPSKKPCFGQGRELVLTLRITVEGMNREQ